MGDTSPPRVGTLASHLAEIKAFLLYYRNLLYLQPVSVRPEEVPHPAEPVSQFEADCLCSPALNN